MQTHVVETGDTWWKIAKTYHVCLQDLLVANARMDQDKTLTVGETIQIPDMREEPEAADESKQNTISPLSPPVFSKAESWGKLGSYQVKAGDSWATIAEHFYLSVEHLKAANPHLLAMNWLPVGQAINIPSIGVTLKEYVQKKQMTKSIPQTHQTHQTHQPYQIYTVPQSVYPLQPVWGMPPYPIYRCNCEYCQQTQYPGRVANEESESSSTQESSTSFWGSSSYFESSSMGWENSSSWLRDSGEEI